MWGLFLIKNMDNTFLEKKAIKTNSVVILEKNCTYIYESLYRGKKSNRFNNFKLENITGNKFCCLTVQAPEDSKTEYNALQNMSYVS
jgi:hypothetical protein